MPVYRPLVVASEMGRYGYWIVTVSIAPGYRIPVQVATIGITQQYAAELAIATAAFHPAVRR